MSIKYKILLPIITCAVLITVAILLVSYMNFSSYVEDSTREDLENSMATVQNYIADRQSMATQSGRLIAADDDLRDAFLSGRRDEILRVGTALMQSTQVGFLTITDAEGNVIVRTHEPDNYGDSILNQENIQSALSGQAITTVETGTAVRMSIRSGNPVYVNGELVGAISAGYRLDQNDIVDSIKAITGVEVTFFLGDERVSTTVENAQGERAVGTKADETVAAKVLGGGSHIGSAPVAGKNATTNYQPLRDHDGEVIGMLFVGKYSESLDAMIFSFMTTGVIVGLVMLLLSIGSGYVVAQRIVVPLGEMVKVADKMAVGNVDVDIHVNTKDELHTLSDSFNRMIDSTRTQAEQISRIAAGDMSASIDIRSEEDIVGRALQNLLDLNNEVFSDIILAADQVAVGSHQIAEGAQSLAQGSTEQASVIEDLSRSISEVASKARDNAQLAAKAAGLSQDIRNYAEEGTDQMGRLSKAVQDINEAGQSIGRVIKVIDDIAFQTNILALNAAVEAARAGQHGKGFSVVAEEVRNLAAKSAAAAKDTGELIANSIERAEEGAKITESTSQSLKKIVEGINESGQISQEIADSSTMASTAIDQINGGITQVSEVVQQNSATAEQSAASSEEMSAQSASLQNMVSRFTLRESSKPRIAAGPRSKAPQALPAFEEDPDNKYM